MRGFTLIEILIVTSVLSVISLAMAPYVKDVMNYHQVGATVETMKAIAAAADTVRQLPDGDEYESVSVAVIATHLALYDANATANALNNLDSFWGNNYLVTTSGRFATVSTSIPLENINPFGVIATPNGASTTLKVSHRPTSTNYQRANASLINKKFLYMETDDE